MILIASASPDLRERFHAGLHDVDLMLTVVDYGSLSEALIHLRPDIVMLDLDLPWLNGTRGIAELRQLHPLSKTVVLSGPLSDEHELDLFIAGARGCCRRDVDPRQIRRIVAAIRQGELWIRRALVARLLDALGVGACEETQMKHVETGRLVDLTQREAQIALLVSDGNTNKQIAHRLDITERTVKAHLTQIFRKLGISDRFMLALRILSLTEPDRQLFS
jgi:two-component system NarL family response regulator